MGLCIRKPFMATERALSAEAVSLSQLQLPPIPLQSVQKQDKIKSSSQRCSRIPSHIVIDTQTLLLSISSDPNNLVHMTELSIKLKELKTILYGDNVKEPIPETCSQITQEFFRDNTFRLLIECLPKLKLEARNMSTQIIENLQKQRVNSRLIASDYLERNTDLLGVLISGYEDKNLALHYGAMLRGCIRHQVAAKYLLGSEHMVKFFGFIQLPKFDVGADAAATFKELLTRHKSTVAGFLQNNYNWFFSEYNTQLLENPNYLIRRQAVKLLSELLFEKSNVNVMVMYVRSVDNLRILMNLMRETSKNIQLDAFHVFKLFIGNENKPSDIVNVLVANRGKLLRLISDINTEKEEDKFASCKEDVLKIISALQTS